MALQVWLPLNGDTRNQGLNPIEMIGSPNSWGNGKIGKCATFSPTSTTPSTKIYNTTTSLNYVNEDFSWSIWINPSSTIYGISYIFTVGRADAGGYGYGLKVSSSAVGCWFGSKQWSVSISTNTWTHLAFCRKGTSITIYKNGTSVISTTFSGTLPTYSDGNGLGLGCFHYSGSVYAYNGSINDFRIYNHCLSPKEVKEISKGLVLHYPMNNCNIEANNLLNNASSYREGTPYTCTTTSKDGYFYTNMYYNNDSLGGQTVTFSVSTNKQIAPSHGASESTHDKVGLWFYLKKTSYSSADGSYNLPINLNSSNDNFKSLGNNRYSWTYTIPSGYKGLMIRTNLYSNNGSSVSANFWDFQLEFGSKASPFNPNKWTSTTVYDCSGFGYNGIAYGNLITDSDTSRYSSSIKFPATTTDYIEMNNSSVFSALDNCTISWWGKYDGTRSLLLTGQATNYYVAAGEPGFYHENVSGTLSYYVDGVKSSSVPSYTSGQWHHYTITGVNITSWTKFLLNHYGNHTQWGIQGKISDFRIYATSLSAEDVKELYNTSAIVCDNGTVMAYSLEE